MSVDVRKVTVRLINSVKFGASWKHDCLTNNGLESKSLTLVTWLILPVVICLSQRLSHACLSLSDYTVRLRTAHYISYSLFDGRLLQG